MENKRTPIVFIHGQWLHADSWKDWIDYFREAGYDPIAPAWPGEPDTVAETRAHPDGVAGKGIGEIADHYAEIIGNLDAKPIVIGHSFGGLIAQNLLGRGLARAGIAIDTAPIKGVLPLPFSSFKMASVSLKNPANHHRAVPLTAEQFRYGFGNTLSEKESDDLYRLFAIPGPGRTFFQVAFANLTPRAATKVATGNSERGPLLLIAGENDRTIPPVMVRATLKQYRKSGAVTELQEMPGRGHSLTIDHGWRDVADTALEWLKEKSLA